MASVDTGTVRKDLSNVLNRVAYGGERLVITRHGKPSAAIVSVEDLELIRAIEDKIDRRAIRKALKKPDAIPWEQAKEELGY
jgi:prevent-host-death family protein